MKPSLAWTTTLASCLALGCKSSPEISGACPFRDDELPGSAQRSGERRVGRRGRHPHFVGRAPGDTNQHATLALTWGQKTLYVDPVEGGHYDELPKPDLILITDIHRDHMSPPTVARLRAAGTLVVVPPAVAPSIAPR